MTGSHPARLIPSVDSATEIVNRRGWTNKPFWSSSSRQQICTWSWYRVIVEGGNIEGPGGTIESQAEYANHKGRHREVGITALVTTAVLGRRAEDSIWNACMWAMAKMSS